MQITVDPSPAVGEFADWRRFPLPLAVKLVADADCAMADDLVSARNSLRQLAQLFEICTMIRVPDCHGESTGAAKGFARGGLASWQLRLVTEHIDEHLSDTVHIDRLAALTKLSGGHFCRAFKTSLGETPHAYIIRRRLDRAKILMLTTSENLSHIAYACGLTDQAHLTRLFRQHVGETPLAWRRAYRLAA